MGQIIAHNQAKFDEMLNNQFCKDMGAASTDQEKDKVLRGYKWYMTVRFSSIIRVNDTL